MTRRFFLKLVAICVPPVVERIYKTFLPFVSTGTAIPPSVGLTLPYTLPYQL